MSTEPVCATCELHAEAVFRVEGMDYDEAVVILERRLTPLDGMEAVAADLLGQRFHVKYDAAKLTTSAMADAVGQTGMRIAGAIALADRLEALSVVFLIAVAEWLESRESAPAVARTR
jgi:hypothetical protein